MKRITLILLTLLSVSILFAQSPQTFKYQAVVRDNSGVLIPNQNISFRIGIIDSIPTGTIVYQETHLVITNDFGLANLEIGNGTPISGLMSDVNWGTNDKFLQVEADLTGGTNYQLMGTSQLLSVPFALHSETTSDTTRWRKDNNGLYYVNGSVGIGTNLPDESALLDLNNSSKGFLPPRMTTIDRESISNPEAGLTIYNTDKNDMEFFDGTKWRQFSILLSNAILCGQDFTDLRDGQIYSTVQIGEQCWMKNNLNYESTSSWCYAYNSSNCDTYGRVYNWEAIMDGASSSNSIPSGVQGICPAGWHVPSDSEWCILTQFIDPTVDCDVFGYTGTDIGFKAKSTISWNSGGNGNDESGFSALAGGWASLGVWENIGNKAHFWTSTEYNTNHLSWTFHFNSNDVEHMDLGYAAVSLRCVKD